MKPIGAHRDLSRRTVRPFTDKQIELVTQLRRPGRHRDRECAAARASCATTIFRALEQQTATSEVLNVISSSPGELEPVFEAMLENAVTHLRCQIRHLLATRGRYPSVWRDARRACSLCRLSARANQVFHPNQTVLGQLVQDEASLSTRRYSGGADVTATNCAKATIDLAGARTLVGSPDAQGQ